MKILNLKTVSRLTSFVLALILLVIVPAASAQSNIYKSLQYPFYDPDFIDSGECAGDDTPLIGSTEAEQAWNFFKSREFKGIRLSDKQVAAILGNFKRESGIKPTRVEDGWGFPDHMDTVPPNVGPDGQPGYGIAQWTNPDRKENLKNFTNITGQPVNTLAHQLEFAFHEMTDENPSPDAWENLATLEDITKATETFEDSFLRSGDDPGEEGMRIRIRAANFYYKLYSGAGDVDQILDPSPGEPICDPEGGIDPPGNACKTGQIIGWTLKGECTMVSYDQTDPRWADRPYGTGKSSLAESGCGPTSLAMIGATLLNDTSITPPALGDRYGDTYHQGSCSGTCWSLFPVFGRDYGLKYTNLDKDLNDAAEIIRKGGLVLISVDPGHFTSGGHLMVIRAINPTGTIFYLADPNGDGYSNDSETRGFPADFLRSSGNMKGLWGYTR